MLSRVKGHLYLIFLTERNGQQSTQRYRTKVKFSFRSVRLEVTVGHFSQNCSSPFRRKADFQVERFKLLAIRSVPFRPKRLFLLMNAMRLEYTNFQ
uniref:Uncharacterized protein n=1 Tax=Romanomermis culicivorax TaxID=13658 RepID=A0A915KE71_ROMCU